MRKNARHPMQSALRRNLTRAMRTRESRELERFRSKVARCCL